MAVVVQLAFWTGATGQSQLLGPLLVSVVGRELGPAAGELADALMQEVRLVRENIQATASVELP